MAVSAFGTGWGQGLSREGRKLTHSLWLSISFLSATWFCSFLPRDKERENKEKEKKEGKLRRKKEGQAAAGVFF